MAYSEKLIDGGTIACDVILFINVLFSNHQRVLTSCRNVLHVVNLAGSEIFPHFFFQF